MIGTHLASTSVSLIVSALGARSNGIIRVSSEGGVDGALGDARGGGRREADGELWRGEVRISLEHNRLPWLMSDRRQTRITRPSYMICLSMIDMIWENLLSLLSRSCRGKGCCLLVFEGGA